MKSSCSGFGNSLGSWFAAPIPSCTRVPFRNTCPSSSMSSAGNRASHRTGLTNRNSSSTAAGSVSGAAPNLFHSSRLSNRYLKDPLKRFAVVSCPAPSRKLQSTTISSSGSCAVPVSGSTKIEIKSFLGSRRRCWISRSSTPWAWVNRSAMCSIAAKSPLYTALGKVAPARVDSRIVSWNSAGTPKRSKITNEGSG